MDKKIFIVAKREYLERVRTRWFVAMTLLVPAVIAGFVMLTAYIGSRGNASDAVRHITIINATNSDLGQRVANALMADTTVATSADSIRPRVLNLAPGDLPAMEQRVASEVQLPNHIAGYLVLSDSTLIGRSVRYAGRNASSLSDMDKLQSVVREAVMMLRLQREGMNPEFISDVARTRLRFNSERLNERGRSGSGTAGVFAGLVVGVMLLMLIVIHGQNILRGVLEEKSTRVAEVVVSSVKPESLLAGKVLGVGGVGLTQQIAWFAITGYLVSFLMPIIMKGTKLGGAAAGAASSPLNGVLNSMSPMVLGVAVAYFIVGFVFYATLYAAAGSMVNSEQEAQQAAAPVMVLIMSAWLCVNPVMLSPSGRLSVALSWLPWSSPIIMPIRMGLTSVAPIEIAGSIIVAALGSIFTIWLSARIYRVGMLMYGKKPSLREVAKWIRYA